MTILATHAIGIVSGLFAWAVVYYLHFHDKCPPKYSSAIALIGTAQLLLSTELVVDAATAAGWDILAYLLLTIAVISLASKGYYEMNNELTLLPTELEQ